MTSGWSSKYLPGFLSVSLMDKSFVKQSLRANDAGMNYLRSSFDNLDVSYLTSYTNFLTIKLGQKTKKIFNELLSQGVILRPLDNYNLSQYLRVTIGSKSENKFLINKITKILRSIK